MAQLNYPHPPDGCQPGERILFNALKRLLPDDDHAWFEPTLYGERHSRRPDFVLLGRDLGLVIIEVKDWSLDAILFANRDTFQIALGRNPVTRTNPEKQAEGHYRTLSQQLEHYRTTAPDHYRQIVQTAGPHAGKLATPITYFVAFPHISRTEWHNSALRLEQVLNPSRVILRDDLTDGLRDQLRRHLVFRPALNQAQLEVLKWMLYPETRIPYKQGQLFTLDAEQIGIARLDTYLPPQAQQLSRKPQAKLVRGVVGSGKTLILLNRAKFISEQNPNWRALVLTFNTALREYLRQVFRELGGDETRVEIINFHKWCADLLTEIDRFHRPQDRASQLGLITNILKESGVTGFEPEFLLDEFNWIKERVDYRQWADYPDAAKVKRTGRRVGLDGPRRAQVYVLFEQYQQKLARHKLSDWADVPLAVLRALDEGVIPAAQYHAVLIDEAQDFAPAWFRVAFRMVKPETGMVFIAGDGAQKIYSQDFTWKELGLGITAQNSFILRQSYRSTHEIIDVALEAIRDSRTLLEDLQAAGDSLIEPERNHREARHGPLPILLTFEAADKEYEGIATEISGLLRQGYLPKDIVILQRHHAGRAEMLAALARRDIPMAVVDGQLDLNQDSVKISTLHSAKGLEFEIVFICGLEAFTVDKPVDTGSLEFQHLLDQERKLLYVGMTRARQKLFITYSGVSPNWIVRRLEQKLARMQPG